VVAKLSVEGGGLACVQILIRHPFFFFVGFSFLRYFCGGGEESRKRSVMRESAMAEKLLDFTQPFDVGLLDATVAAFYGTGSKHERAAAERVLRQLQEHPDTWTRVVAVLQNSQNLNSKFYALRVLEGVIKYRWNALPVEQRDGIKNYISDLIVQVSFCNICVMP
jgi:hypothetical protein